MPHAAPEQYQTAPHQPVLLGAVLETLNPQNGEIYVDGTFGAGGYTEAILASADCTVIALDRDPTVQQHVARLTEKFGDRLQFWEGRFGDLADLLEQNGITQLDGVVLDLGVSSMQIDTAERGFSFMRDGPLDMRMSATGPTAADVVNAYALDDLAQILSVYGEEKKSRAIARAIIRKRELAPITRTQELVECVASVLGPHRGKGAHPATRTFQALRIFVNDELGELNRGLFAAERALSPQGRLVVVTFHSLEDRVVKHFLAARTGQLGRPSRHVPETVRAEPSFVLGHRRSVTADDAEREQNSRARSARLRMAIRTQAPALPDNVTLPSARLAPHLVHGAVS